MKISRFLAHLGVLGLLGASLAGCMTTQATTLPDGSTQFDVTTKTDLFGSPVVNTQYRLARGRHSKLQLISSSSAAAPETVLLGAVAGGLTNSVGTVAAAHIIARTGNASVGSIVNVNNLKQVAPSTTVVH